MSLQSNYLLINNYLCITYLNYEIRKFTFRAVR